MMKLPPIQHIPSKERYQKPDSIKELERLATDAARLKHPTLPEHALAMRKFRDDSANSLTKCITSYIILKGGFSSRVNNGGIYDQRRKKYRPGTSRRGLPDIISTYLGKSLFIEVKYAKDKLSQYQKDVQSDQELAGGYFYTAHSFSDFKSWFDNLK